MNIQRTIKAMAIFICWALLSTEALAVVGTRMPIDARAANCLAAVAAGEANGYGDKALINTMRVVAKRYLLGYGSSICAVASAPKQFAPRPSRVTTHIRLLAARVLRESPASILATAPTNFHSYKNIHDRRAPWARNFAYLGHDGAHHLFINKRAGVVNTRLAAINQQQYGRGQEIQDSPSTILANTGDRNRLSFWT